MGDVRQPDRRHARAASDLPAHQRRPAPLARQNFDALGAVLVTGGMLLLVYALVKAPDVGWGAARTIGEIAGAVGLLVAFVVNEQRTRNPLMPLSIFRIKGLAAADATQLVGIAGFLSMFFFLTLYMQNVLGYSAIQTGAAYLPLCFAVGISAGVSSQLVTRIGTRPVIVVGALIGAAGRLLALADSRARFLRQRPAAGPVDRRARPRRCVRRRHHRRQRGRPARQGRARRCTSQLLAAARRRAGARDLLRDRDVSHQRPAASGASQPEALTSGFQRALFAASLFLLAAAIVGLRATNTRGEEPAQTTAAGASPAGEPELAAAPGRAGA